jgi:hypothetical protein
MMKRPFSVPPRLRRSSALAAFAICTLLSAHSFAVAPDWVHAATNQTLMPVDKDVNAIVLLDDQTTTVQDNGDVFTLDRRVVKILRPEGRELARVHVYFDNETRLKSVHAWSITAKGTEYELKDKDFRELSPYDGESLYSDVRVKEAEAPGADPGTVVAWEFAQRQRPYLMEDSWQFQERIPVQLTRYTLRLPAGWEYAASWFEHGEVKPTEAGANAWTWQLSQIPGIEHEPHMPSWRSLAGRMEISYFGNIRGQAVKSARSWQQIGNWYSDLAAGRRQATPEIHERAIQLTAGKSTFAGKVSAIASFLQTDIRYVAIEIGIGGYQPHPASDVFRNRYGDCKDKATLMSSMLHEAGIESHYLAVNTSRGEVGPGTPSMYFDHMILAIAVPKGDSSENLATVVNTKSGKYLIFDPTDQYTPVGQIHYDLQGSYALLVTDGGGELILIPVLPPIDNQIKRVAHLKLQPDGSLLGEVQETRTGEHAWVSRAQLLNTHGNEREKALERFLGGFLTGFSLEKSEAENLDHNDQDLILKYKFSARSYAKNAGPLLLVRPRVLGALEFQWMTDKPRKFPIEFAAASHETDVFEIELPAGFAVDEIPDPVKMDVGFAHYESKTEVQGQVLRYSRDYTVNQLQIPTTEEAQLKRLFSTIYSDERNSAVLKKQ